MAKRKTKRRRRASHSGRGSFCVTTTKPRGRSGRGRGGISFSTVCYGTQAKAMAALKKRATGSYTAMLHKRGKRR